MRAKNDAESAAIGGYIIQRSMCWSEDHEANLRQVEIEANRQIRGELAKVFGALSIAPKRYRDNTFIGLCLRSKSLPSFGGAEFRLDIGSSVPGMPATALVSDIRSTVQRFRDNREQISGFAKEAQAIADKIMGSISDVHPAPRLIAISVFPRVSLKKFEMGTTLEVLGDGLGLGPETIRAHVSNGAKLRRGLADMLATHARRADLLAQHRANHTRGLIDQTAQNLLSVSGMKLTYALDQLERAGKLQFLLNGGRTTGRLEWKEDILTGEVFERNNEVDLRQGTFTFWQQMPQTILAALVGRPLSVMIAKPYFPLDAIIMDFSAFGTDGTRLDLEIPTTPLPDHCTHV